MDNKPIYEEDFVNSRVYNNPDSIQYVLGEIRDCHPKEYGWVMGKPSVTPNPDGITATINVHLAQYEVENHRHTR